MQSTMSAGRDPHKHRAYDIAHRKQKHDIVIQKLSEKLRDKVGVVPRANAVREREEQARPLRRAEERAQAEHLIAIARNNDDRTGNNRTGGVGSGAPGGISTNGMQNMPGHRHDQHVGDLVMASHHAVASAGVVPQHLHMQQQNGVGGIGGIPCASTMDPSGVAGLPAPLCNPVSKSPEHSRVQ